MREEENMSKQLKKLISYLRIGAIVEEEIRQGITKPSHREKRSQELIWYFKRKRAKELAMIKEFKEQQQEQKDRSIGESQKKYGPVC